MRLLRRITLSQILLVMGVIFTLVISATVTFSLARRDDEVNKKRNRVIFAAEHNVGSEADISEDIDTAVTDADNTELSDISAARNDYLTAAATSTDATEGDAAQLNGRKVYLTFDDGPSDTTDELLKILREYGVKATFFVVNNYDHEEELQAIADEGHTIGLHSACHEYSKLYASQSAYESDVYKVHHWVKRVTGIDSRLYRFPGGSSNNVSDIPISDCIDFLHSEGYEYYDWNAESRDAENLYLTPEQLNNNIMNSVRSNEGDSIVLMHDLDDHYNTVQALPDLIETLQSEGYELCTIDEDTTPVQHYVP